MRAFIRTALLFSLIMIQNDSSAQNPNGLKDVRARLVEGLYSNDERAFSEVSKLPLDQAVPMLSVYVDDASTNEERAIRARETLRKMPGVSGYMKQRILEKRSKAGGEYEMGEFRLLRVIGGDEAAAAVAPFLFVDDPPLLVADDFSAGPIYSLAFAALVEMRLPDAPKGELEEWKVWAEKRGYRDPKIPQLMTLQQKGVPPGAIARSESILSSAKPSPVTTPRTPKSNAPTTTPLPATPPSALVPAVATQIARVAENPAPVVEQKSPVWPWVVGILTLLAIVAFAFKRRA